MSASSARAGDITRCRLGDGTRSARRVGNALFIVEHEPIITLGRNFQSSSLLHTREHLAKLGIDVCEVDRGGDATYHGPGQLVAYPVLDLNQWTPSIKWYLRKLEEVIIAVLARYGLAGERLERHTGVWVGGAKVAAIGIGLHTGSRFTASRSTSIPIWPTLG